MKVFCVKAGVGLKYDVHMDMSGQISRVVITCMHIIYTSSVGRCFGIGSSEDNLFVVKNCSSEKRLC